MGTVAPRRRSTIGPAAFQGLDASLCVCPGSRHARAELNRRYHACGERTLEASANEPHSRALACAEDKGHDFGA